MDAQSHNRRIQSVRVGMTVAEVVSIVGPPLAHLEESPFAIAPGTEFAEVGSSFAFPVADSTEYLIYQHPIRQRAFEILGFEDGRFVGGSRTTFATSAPEEMEKRLAAWRKASLR